MGQQHQFTKRPMRTRRCNGTIEDPPRKVGGFTCQREASVLRYPSTGNGSPQSPHRIIDVCNTPRSPCCGRIATISCRLMVCAVPIRTGVCYTGGTPRGMNLQNRQVKPHDPRCRPVKGLFALWPTLADNRFSLPQAGRTRKARLLPTVLQ
jgi:hypothetical protein